jgi:LysM repeat protein
MIQSMNRTQKIILAILATCALAVVILAVVVVVKNMPPALPGAASASQTAFDGTSSNNPESGSTPSPLPGTPTITASPTPATYTVQAGDTLTSIAELFGVTVEDLYSWNGLSSDIIQPGWQLTVTAPLAELLTPTTAVTEVTAVETPTTTSAPLVEATQHWVTNEDMLESIASLYQLTPADLRAANYMVGDALLPGMRLVIPGTLAPALPYQFSVLEGDLLSAYPLQYQADRLTLHTAPNTYPSIDPEALAVLELSALEHIEGLFKTTLNQHFDVFVAGSVFAPPDRALRGRSFSLNRQTLFLHDGTGNAADQLYIATHELTHLFSWNVFGAPVSTMLSEGAAAYSGMEAIRGQGHLPVEIFCAAYLQAGQLPRVSGSLSFEGHILDLQNYYAAGCFVGYLIEVYDPYNFARLYPTGDFETVYGKSASDLEDEWRGVLALESIPAGLSPERLVSSVTRLERTYLDFFSGFSGTTVQLGAYRELDLARLALLSGDLDAFDALLILYEAALQAP